MDDVPIAIDLPPPPPPLAIGSGAPAPDAKSDLFYKFWDRFTKKKSSKLTPSIDRDEEGLPSHHPGKNEDGIVTSQSATTSYEEAAATCKGKVDAIVAECRRLNVKYYDPLFDLTEDKYDCLVSLSPSEIPDSAKGLTAVGAVKRIEDIYENPKFYIDGINANDIKQGYVGDCWFLAAITALSGKPELLEKVCVARDEKVGVYGFVFYRDCEWISVVVDDRLYLKRGDDNMQYPTEYMINVSGDQPMNQIGLFPGGYYLSKLPKEFRESLRKGSNALYFSSCRESNETWLPLLEKAYAKAHGDYQAIEGGYTGEGIEDLTGGVAISIPSENILDKDQLWSELMQVNTKFLFGCSSRRGRDSDPEDDEGFVRGHAYTVLEAKVIKYKEKDTRLLKIRNPWGNQEWNGAWSDGSKEWTADTMKELNHTFGDDGIFWISYQDFLKYYPYIDRIRLFGSEWTVTQQWACVEVPWTSDYLSTRFTLSIKKKSSVVLVLSQPDDRYFQGLTGRYSFELHFRLYKDGQKTYVLRSMEGSGSGRSCNAELELDEGDYTILVKITAQRDDEDRTPEEVIKENRQDRREKLLSIGRSFDLTHSKGRLREVETAVVEREKKDSKAKTKATMVAGRNKRKRQRERERRRAARIEAEKERKKAAKKAEKAKQNGSVDGDPKQDDEPQGDAAKEEADKQADTATSTEAAKSAEPVKEEPVKEKMETPRPEVVIPAPEPVEEVLSPKAPAPAPALAPPSTPKSPRSSHTRTGSHPQTSSSKHPEAAAAAAAAPPVSQTNVPAEAEASTPTTGKKASDEKKDDEKKDAAAEDAKDAPEDPKPMDKKEMITELREIATQLEADDDNISISSVEDDDFDWDSDIDGSESSDSEEEDDNDEMYADDPWRAICVVGLKVFHVDAGVELGVTHK